MKCPACLQPMVSTSGDLCYGCGWKLPAAGGIPKEGGPYSASGAQLIAELSAAAAVTGTRANFCALAASLDALEAFDATDSGPGRHEALASILDDICRAWKALKEPG